jgi:hypothetical protein
VIFMLVLNPRSRVKFVTARVLLSHDNKSDACTSGKLRIELPDHRANQTVLKQEISLVTLPFMSYLRFFHLTAAIPWFARPCVSIEGGSEMGWWSDVGGADQRFREAKAHFACVVIGQTPTADHSPEFQVNV